jgi:SPP1 gp7 family putative phage head morphogenesis protein
MPRNPHIDAILLDRYGGGRKVPKATRQVEPRALERTYLRSILDLLEPAGQLVDELLISRLPELDAELGVGDSRLDAYPDILEQVFGDIRLRYAQTVTTSTIRATANDQGGQIDLFNREQASRQLKRLLGIDVFAISPELTTEIDAFTVDNVGLIESIPERYFAEIQNTALRNLRAGNRSTEWRDELFQRYDVSKSRAALIARDQTNKFNGELNRVRQEALGIDDYKWRTAGDERVRLSHQELEGLTFSWTDPERQPPEGHPGQPIQCRCQAEPDIEAVLRDLDI